MSAPHTTTYAATDILQYLLNSGTINIDDVAADMKKEEQKKILNQHPYPISKGKDGRYRTYVKKEDGSRKQIAKSSYDKVVEALGDYYGSMSDRVSMEKMMLEALYPVWIEYKRIHAAASTYLKRIDSNWRNWYIGTDIIRKPIVETEQIGSGCLGT